MVFLNRYDIQLTNITIDLYKDAKIPVGNYHVKNLWQDQLKDVTAGKTYLSIMNHGWTDVIVEIVMYSSVPNKRWAVYKV